MDDIDDKDLARLLGLGRIAIGGAAALMPRVAARVWLGREPDLAGRLALRGVGVRDVAIGAGTLVALERGAPVRGWLEAGAAADAADAFGTLSGWSEIPTLRKIMWLSLEVGAAVLGLRLADSLD